MPATNMVISVNTPFGEMLLRGSPPPTPEEITAANLNMQACYVQALDHAFLPANPPVRLSWLQLTQ